MSWCPDGYMESLYDSMVQELSFKAGDMEQWSCWRQKLQDKLIDLLGVGSEDKVDLAPCIIEECEYKGLIRQRVVFASGKNLSVPAYVLVPKGASGPFPAVIACHGHGYGSREIIGLNPDGSENTGSPGYQMNFGLELAKRGFLVVIPDLLGFGDRRVIEDKDKEPNHSSCYPISKYLMMMGKNIAGVRVFDTMRTVDYLVTRNDVCHDRVGCMGISGGGLVCSFAAALDERIKAAVVSGYANTFRDSIMSVFHCIDNIIPGITRYAEMPDIIGLIAPRPLFIESGTEDDIFPVGATRKAFEKIREVYRLLGMDERLDRDIFEGGHRINGEKAYEWLERWL